MVAEDFQAALPILRDAEINFGASGETRQFLAIPHDRSQKQADTRLLASAARFQLGKRQEAVAANRVRNRAV